MVRLVVSDIDGTLVDGSEQLTPDAYALADYLKSKRILFSLATGRVQGMAQPYVDELNIHVPYVTANGAALLKDGETLRRYTFALNPIRDVIHAADQMGMTIIYSQDGFELVHQLTPFVAAQRLQFDRYQTVVPLTEAFLTTRRLEKLCLMDDTQSGRISLLEQMLTGIDGGFEYTRYQDRAIELVCAGRTKAAGVADLSQYLHIDLADVMCIGDDENDLEMLSQAGVSATVQNALPKVKHSVQLVASRDHASGVLEAVRQVVEHQAAGEI
ncbi:MAG: HAD family phosphatase [Clostridia bacterium]|nr:HAD family phosphatase [Clostridia bacterium]